MMQPSSKNWLKPGKKFDKYGSPKIVLNKDGLLKWQSYSHETTMVWTEWQTAKTVARSDGKIGSQVEIETILPLFSFEKTQVAW